MADLTVTDPGFGVDDFNAPLMYTSDETIVRNLLLILFGKPGFYPSVPNFGMYIQQYMYELEDDMDTTILKARLAYQCQEFLPFIRDGELNIFTTHKNGNPVMVFTLPVIRNSHYATLILGVTILNNGEMQFNFKFNDEAQTI